MKSSVIVISHERKELLIRALNSLNMQERLPDEVIVVDDNSSSFDVYALKNIDYKFTLNIYKNAQNKGANYSRNFGIQQSSNEIIFFLDDDDEFTSRKIKIFMEKFSEHKNIDLMTSGFMKYYEDYNYTKEKYKKKYVGAISQVQTLKKNVIGGTSLAAMKRKVFLDCGYFDESLVALQDKEYWLRVSKNKSCICVIPDPLVKYRITSSNNRISNSIDKFWSATNYIEKKHFTVVKDMPSADIIEYRSRNLQLVGLKYLLNHNRWSAFNSFRAALKNKFSIKNLLIMTLPILPNWLIIRLI